MIGLHPRRRARPSPQTWGKVPPYRGQAAAENTSVAAETARQVDKTERAVRMDAARRQGACDPPRVPTHNALWNSGAVFLDGRDRRERGQNQGRLAAQCRGVIVSVSPRRTGEGSLLHLHRRSVVTEITRT